mmetsp:Transcript_26679/g.41595  ORF Transcript_26679/g.41595 Transcript_26679/m.41595 type:complete len:261 (-) Transcript_26679:651-1433(-)
MDNLLVVVVTGILLVVVMGSLLVALGILLVVLVGSLLVVGLVVGNLLFVGLAMGNHPLVAGLVDNLLVVELVDSPLVVAVVGNLLVGLVVVMDNLLVVVVTGILLVVVMGSLLVDLVVGMDNLLVVVLEDTPGLREGEGTWDDSHQVQLGGVFEEEKGAQLQWFSFHNLDEEVNQGASQLAGLLISKEGWVVEHRTSVEKKQKLEVNLEEKQERTYFEGEKKGQGERQWVNAEIEVQQWGRWGERKEVHSLLVGGDQKLW